MTDIVILNAKGKGEVGTPDPSKLLKGKYKTRTWNQFSGEDGRLFSGIWESTPGKVAVAYDEWEFCHIIQGKAILTNEAGKKWTVKKGDAFIIEPGFKGSWETVTKLRKHYVILMPKS